MQVWTSALRLSQDHIPDILYGVPGFHIARSQVFVVDPMDYCSGGNFNTARARGWPLGVISRPDAYPLATTALNAMFLPFSATPTHAWSGLFLRREAGRGQFRRSEERRVGKECA